MSNKAYYLMHKNIKVAAFILEGKSVIGVKINDRKREHLPVNYQDDIASWLMNRGIPVTRQGLRNDIGSTDTFDYMITNLGLSLTDCYWIKPAGEECGYTWENINLYDNEFRETMSLDIDSDGNRSIAGKTNFVPSASLKGDLRKKWVINERGERVLIKGNYSSGCMQSISEVLASRIYRNQTYKVEYTNYGLIDVSSNGRKVRGCYCRNFTTQRLELIHAYDLVSKVKKPNDMNYFQLYKEILKANGINADSFYDMEIMVDFIITNIDRHFNNFGVLRDADNLKIVKPAPIFDSGNAMFYRDSYVPVDKGLLDIDVTSFNKKEVKLLSQVTNRGILDIRYLPTNDELYELLLEDYTIDEIRRERLIRAYNKKIKYLEDFQNGANIWSYKYRS